LLIRPSDGQADSVPLADVGTVLLGLGVSMGGAVLQQLAEFDVITLMCDWRGVPVAGSYGWREHTRVGARHRAQAEATRPRLKNAWGRVIRAKVAGQAANLKHRGCPDWEHLDTIARHVRSGDPDNAEARAAHFYWSRLFPNESFVRVPSTGSGRNAMLDYGYMVLRGSGIRAVLGAGLSPTLGMFHRGRANAFNLVDDLIEPFRPAVDSVVLQLGATMTPTHPSVKAALVGAIGQPFQPSGATVATALSDLARQYGRYLEGEDQRLNVPAWSGPPPGEQP
jgi:CRISPR-associated protein Cas1